MTKIIFLVVSVFLISTLCAMKFEIPLASFDFRFSDKLTVDKASVDTESRYISIYMTVESSWLEKLDDYSLEMLNRFYLNFLIEKKIDFKGITFFVRQNNIEEYQHILNFLAKLPPVPKKEGESVPKVKSLVPEKKYGNIEGGLTGKTIFVSPGHGWTYNTDNGNWNTQRGITLGMREDDSNAEIVSYFLVPYLQNAGALVFSARETDRNELMVIVDDADGSVFPDSGIYEEGGSWAETTSGKGYGRTNYPVEIENNVLTNGKYRYATAGTGSWAKWTPNIPESGNYHIYVSYKTFTDRAPDAVYTISYSGGSSEITVNQKHHGSTWVDIGQFYFKKGSSGSVILNNNDDAEGGTIIIADAVRFGGGTGILKRGTATSKKPRWEEAAKVHAQFLGAPSSVYQSSANDNTADVTARSRWTAWENESGIDDSIYISWHSNAYNGGARGISTYIYSSHDPGSTYVTTEAQTGSVELAEFVHNRILDAVKTLFNSSWPKYGMGLYSAYFGELNPSHNNEMPACLVELAFHDNELDAAMLKNPQFRNIAARAAYQAIVKYFADRDSYEPTYLPGNPRNLMTKTNNDGSITLLWEDPESDAEFHLGHPATGYIVQMSSDGKSFDSGTDIGNVNQFKLSDTEPGKPVYFRVIAYNDGGVSFPSVVAGAIPIKTGAQVLIVDGFERVDQNTPRFNLGTSGSNRYILEFINSFNYVIQYLEVFEQLGFSADFTQKKNIRSIDVSQYDAVIWFAGEQSSNDITFSIDEQGVIAQYIFDGGAFFVSGSEIGWDLVEKGSPSDIDFFNEILNADYISDSSNLYTFKGTGSFSTISGLFDDGTYIYQANYPDVIEPFNSSGENFLFYDNNQTLGAGVLTNTGKKVAMLGFPFETILDFDTKKGIMEKVFEKFAITPKEIPDEEETDDEDYSDEDADVVEEYDDDTAISDEAATPDEVETPDEIATPDETEITDDSIMNDDGDDSVEETKKKDKGCNIIFI